MLTTAAFALGYIAVAIFLATTANVFLRAAIGRTGGLGKRLAIILACGVVILPINMFVL